MKKINVKAYEVNERKPGKKYQLFFEGEPKCAGDVVKMNPDSQEAKELLGRGVVSEFVQKQKKKGKDEIPNQVGNDKSDTADDDVKV